MTRRALLLSAAVAALAIPAFAADPPKRPPKEYTIEQFLATTAITGASFSSDGTMLLFSSNAAGIVDVYSVQRAGGAPTALTKSTTDTTTAVSDERHGFTKKKPQIEGWSGILKFLDRHLKGRGATAAASGAP